MLLFSGIISFQPVILTTVGGLFLIKRCNLWTDDICSKNNKLMHVLALISCKDAYRMSGSSITFYTGRQQGSNTGRQEGRRAGRQEGRKAGRQEGRKAGRQEGS
jgi:hypothetical protein